MVMHNALKTNLKSSLTFFLDFALLKIALLDEPLGCARVLPFRSKDSMLFPFLLPTQPRRMQS